MISHETETYNLISTDQRFTISAPCPICGHYGTDPEGHCHGFLSENGKWAYCTSDEHANGAVLKENLCPPAYLHKRNSDGSCRPWTEAPPQRQRRAPAPHPRTISPKPAPKPAPPKLDAKTHERHEGERVWYYTDDQRIYRRDFWNLKKGEAGAWHKDVRPQHLTPNGWAFGNGPGSIARVYRRADLAANLENVVFVVEGEPCADALRERGLLVVTWRGGTGQVNKAIPQIVDALTGRDVILAPDADTPGRKAIDSIARALTGKATRLRILEVFEDESGRDIEDLLPELPTASLLEWIEAVPDFTPAPDTKRATRPLTRRLRLASRGDRVVW